MAGAIGQTHYPTRHTGVLLVVGSAPCAVEDFTHAIGMFPGAKVMAINEAAAIVPAEFIASLHVEKMGRYRRLQAEKFGDGHFTTHGPAPDAYFPTVDYYWHGAHTGATSAWCGVLVGKAMGFQTIVLCGCPMNGGDGYAVNTGKDKNCPRFGLSPAHSAVVRSHKRAFQEIVETGQGIGVYSMSGYTRELLGMPQAEEKRRARR